MAEILDFVPYKTHMSLKIRTEAHARKMKVISFWCRATSIVNYSGGEKTSLLHFEKGTVSRAESETA
jgi:hypothetical protein